eukprot:jgi/Botrbrau1/11445/Bobra.0328s0005.1
MLVELLQLRRGITGELIRRRQRSHHWVRASLRRSSRRYERAECIHVPIGLYTRELPLLLQTRGCSIGYRAQYHARPRSWVRILLSATRYMPPRCERLNF